MKTTNKEPIIINEPGKSQISNQEIRDFFANLKRRSKKYRGPYITGQTQIQEDFKNLPSSSGK